MNYECIVFTYDAVHRKTYDTLCLLKIKGYSNVMVWALPMHYKKKFHPIYDHRPVAYTYMNPKNVAKELGFTYQLAENFSNFSYEASIPILICGAGIIPNDIVQKHKIINSHPGFIPFARGLDALKWAIVEKKTIGVTTHLLGEEIDAGQIIDRKEIDIYKNDTFHSVAQRVYETEILMLVEAIELLDAPHLYIGANNYVLHKRMPPDIENKLMISFDEYKEKYAKEL